MTKIEPNQMLIELASVPENVAVRSVTRDPPYLGGRWGEYWLLVETECLSI